MAAGLVLARQLLLFAAGGCRQGDDRAFLSFGDPNIEVGAELVLQGHLGDPLVDILDGHEDKQGGLSETVEQPLRRLPGGQVTGPDLRSFSVRQEWP